MTPEVNPFGPDQNVADLGGNAAERRAQWGVVLKGAALYTAMAVQARDWVKAKQGEELMSTASGRAGLESALLVAICGGEVPAVDMSNRLLVACFEAGKTACDEQVAKARAVVQENKASREAAAQERREAERAQRAEQAHQARSAQTAERKSKAEQAGLVVGEIVQVTWTYKQAKRDVATTASGVIVECYGRLPGCGEGSGQARVAKVGGRLPVVELIG